ncbi:uncharacterized protein LOC125010778 [Mugil cephalus]|uniref:uncharacterized protein LOC125010778 n=1 Tax=Mugil cephalus TaxID=48193 RepID=UPI001FB67B99|nr:uncharacterized protein LOC125010778 [Mugil cephalus]
MHFLCIFVLMLSSLTRAFPAPVDTVVIQIQQWGLVGAQQVMEQVLLNGVSYTSTNQEVSSLIQTMSSDRLLPTLISANQIPELRNHTFLRSRECILEGSELHWTDRVFCDGEVCLTLDHNVDTWTTHTPKALALKVLWDQEVQRTRAEKIRLQEGCIKLMKELRLSEERSVSRIPWPQFLIPTLSIIVFMGPVLITFLISKKQGFGQTGGVIGSIIHYPTDMSQMASEKKSSDYSTISLKAPQYQPLV